MNAFATSADELDEWLTIQFAAIIITRFFKKIRDQSRQYHFYQRHKIKTRALNNYLSHLTTFKPNQNPTYSHQQQQQSTPNKFSSNSSKSNSTEYYQSLLHQTPHLFTPSLQSTNKTKNYHETLSDKFQFWRNIIELKRIHPHYSHVILMKCLIESQGDLHKAMILADDSDYILSQQQLSNSNQPLIQFNSSMKELFLPFYERYQYYHHMVDELDDTDPAATLSSTRQDSNDYDHINVNTRISTIRSLKLRHHHQHSTNNDDNYQQQQLYKRKKDLLFHFINVIEKTYVSSSSPMMNGKSSLKKGRLKNTK